MLEKTGSKTRELLKKAEWLKSAPDADSSVAGARRVFPTAETAQKAFAHFRQRLLRVAGWNDFSDISSFEVFNPDGDLQTETLAREEDFIKVTLPGSGKADWVKIVEISDSPAEIVLVVHPSYDPTSAASSDSTSHFFTKDSSNNFCLQRENTTVNFHVIGLNEKTNTEDTGGVLETVRNFVTANVGCFFGIQKMQWRRFCGNFLDNGEIIK